MHRSGSSAFTRTLTFLGLTLPKTLVPGSKNDNDLGFWESQPQVDLNDEFLGAIGSHWYDFAPPDLDQVPEELKQNFIARAVRLIEEEFADAPLFVMKDPRISLLFPLWHEALQQAGIKTLCVLPIRNPLDIISSLYKRNRIPQGEGLVSWLRFVLNAERYSRDCTRVFVHYDDLLTDWRRVTARISTELNLTWPNISDAAAEKADTFLSDKWRHHYAGDAALLKDPAASPWVKDTYRILRAWSQNNIAKTDQKTLDSISTAFDDSVPTYRKLASESRALSIHVREFERKNIKLQEEVLEHRNAKAAAVAKAAQTEAALAEALAKSDSMALNQAKLETLAETEAMLAEALANAQAGAHQVADEYQKRVSLLETEKAALEQEQRALRTTVADLRKALNETTEEFSARLDAYTAQIQAARDMAASQNGLTRKIRNIPRRSFRVIKRLIQA